MAKNLDGYFFKYGVTKDDMKIVTDACVAQGIDPDWFAEEILSQYQIMKNDGKTDNATVNKIFRQAINKL